MPDLAKMARERDSVFAKLFEREMVASMERTYQLISMCPPEPPSITAIAARHFPRVAAVLSIPGRVREAVAAARYKLGVRVIGYDPAPPEDE